MCVFLSFEFSPFSPFIWLDIDKVDPLMGKNNNNKKNHPVFSVIHNTGKWPGLSNGSKVAVVIINNVAMNIVF